MKKKVLTLSSVIILLMMLVFSASASGIKEFTSKSSFTPVTYPGHKSTSTVTLYGNADYLCMKAYSERNQSEYFCLKVYSDSKRTKEIMSYANTFKKGTFYDDILVDLTSLKSRTYYATSYVMKESQIIAYGNKIKEDPASVRNFKLVVKRDGTSIKNMKCFMYGYENTYYGPAVYWYSVPGATKYYVYRYQDKQYKKIATVKANGGDFSYYIDKSLKDKNATRYYKVKAVNGTGSTAMSINKVKVIALKTPKVTAALSEKNGIKVTWTKPNNSCSYIVYRSKNGGDWEELKKTGSRTYTDCNVESGATYYYTVMAYNKTAVSGYDPYGAECRYIAMPSLKAVESKDNNLVVKWDSVKGAQSYNVYRKTSEETSWKKVANVTSTSYTDSACERNKIYTYTVRAVIGNKMSLYKTKGISGAMIDAPVLSEIERTEDGYAKIAWSKIDGVSYKVYRRNSTSGWKHIKTTDSTEYVDTENLVNGRQYYYTVKAHIGSVNGEYDSVGKGFVKYSPVYVSVKDTITNGLVVSWSEVEKSEKYVIYRKSADEEFVCIGDTEDEIYNDTTAVAGINYVYKIIYMHNGMEQTEYAATKSVKINENFLALRPEEAMVYYPEAYNANLAINLNNLDKEASYCVFEKTDEGLKAVDSNLVNDSIYVNAFSSEKIIYMITSVSKDGIINRSPSEGFTFEKIQKTAVTAVPDHKKCEITVTWQAVDGAEKYYLYRNNKLIKTYNEPTAYIDSGLKPGTYREYKVATVKGNSSCMSEVAYSTIMQIPKIQKVKLAEKGINIIWWGNYSYNLYRKAEGEKNWTLIVKNSKNTNIVDSNVKDGKTYYYTISPISSDGQEGYYDETGVKATFLKPPKIKSLTCYEKSVQIKWTKSPAADYYKVYKKTADGNYKLVLTTKNADVITFKDTKVKVGSHYHYRIKAIKGEFVSQPSEAECLFVIPPKNVKATAVSNGVKISFDSQYGGTHYCIYRKTGNNSWKRIARIKKKNTSYVDTTAVKGKKYSYYVKTYNKHVETYSAKSSTVTIKR